MLTVGIFPVKSTRSNLRNAVFTANIKLCRKRWKWPFSTRKAMGKLNKTIRKLSAALTPVYIHNTTTANGSSIATNGLPCNVKNERRRQRCFQFCWRQLSRRQAVERVFFLLRSALGAEDDSTPQIRFRAGNQWRIQGGGGGGGRPPIGPCNFW